MNDIINKQMNFGTRINIYRASCDKSKPAPMSKRTMQILNYMRLGYPSVPEPVHADSKLSAINKYPKSRQMRYFGAWCLDQWDHAANELRKTNLDEYVIKGYKDEFISILHDDFDSGKAYEYADEWYHSFPSGGYYNPYRFGMIYEDESEITSKVTEFVKCRLGHPAVANFMKNNKPDHFDHTLSLTDGGVLVAYKADSDVHDSLVSHVGEMDKYVSELIGEDENAKNGQRIFVTDSVLSDQQNNLDTCVVYYSGFVTYEPELLMSSVKAAISEAIPMERWRDSNVMIDTNKVCVMRGQIDMCRKYLGNQDAANDIIMDLPKEFSDEFLNEALVPNEFNKDNDFQFK